MKKKYFFVLLIIFVLSFIIFPFYTPTDVSKLKCVDGDTFAIGKKFYRLAYIDTPEKGQANYKEASDYTCYFIKNRNVKFETTGLDKYNRTLVSVTDENGFNLNILLVDNCLAEPFYGADNETSHTVLDLYKHCK